MKESTYLKDFAAGAEPTGIYTFRNAYRNKGKHGRHKTFGNVGGFAGGAILSTGMTAGGLAAGGALLKRTKWGGISRHLVEGAKDSLTLFNPVKTVRVMKAFPKGMGISMRQKKLFENVERTTQRAERYVKGKKKIDITTELPERSRQALEKEVYKPYKKLEADKIQFRQKHKMDPFVAVRKGMAVIGGATTGTLGGGLNALSAHAQYDSGVKARKGTLLPKQEQKKFLKKLGFKSDKIWAERNIMPKLIYKEINYA